MPSSEENGGHFCIPVRARQEKKATIRLRLERRPIGSHCRAAASALRGVDPADVTINIRVDEPPRGPEPPAAHGPPRGQDVLHRDPRSARRPCRVSWTGSSPTSDATAGDRVRGRRARAVGGRP